MVLDPTKGGELKIPALPDHTNAAESEFATQGISVNCHPGENIISTEPHDSFANVGDGNKDTAPIAPNSAQGRGRVYGESYLEYFKSITDSGKRADVALKAAGEVGKAVRSAYTTIHHLKDKLYEGTADISIKFDETGKIASKEDIRITLRGEDPIYPARDGTIKFSEVLINFIWSEREKIQGNPNRSLKIDDVTFNSEVEPD